MSIRQGDKIISVTTPFDSAVVELVSGLNKQKQILAQALTQKGIEVSSTDSLDTMAAKVKEMDVVGATDKVICEFHNQFNKDISSLSSKIGSSFSRVIYARNAIVSRTEGGAFGIYKLLQDGTLTAIASCDCSDFAAATTAENFQMWGFSKNAEYIAHFDSKLKSLILFHMNWETNTLTRMLAYTITTANIGSAGKSTSGSSSTSYMMYGLAVAEDGSKVCILSNNRNYYMHSTVIDVATQTETTNCGYTANAPAVMNEYVGCGDYIWDTTTGIIEASTPQRPLFKFHLDLSGDIPTMQFMGDVVIPSGSDSKGLYSLPYFLHEKGFLLQMSSEQANAKISRGNPLKGTLYLKDIATGMLLDSVTVSTDCELYLDKSGGYASWFGCQETNIPFVTKKDGKIIIGYGPFMRFELDEKNKKLIPYKHNGATNPLNGGYVCFHTRYNSSELSQSSSGTPVKQYIYCDENPDLILCFQTVQYLQDISKGGYTVTIFYEEPCVLGVYYNRNGAKNLMYPSNFTYTKYKAGEFSDKDEVAVVEL